MSPHLLQSSFFRTQAMAGMKYGWTYVILGCGDTRGVLHSAVPRLAEVKNMKGTGKRGKPKHCPTGGDSGPTFAKVWTVAQTHPVCLMSGTDQE